MGYGKSGSVLPSSRNAMPAGDFVRAQARERKLADKYRPHCPLGPATAFGVTCVVETWTRPRQSGADPQPPSGDIASSAMGYAEMGNQLVNRADRGSPSAGTFACRRHKFPSIGGPAGAGEHLPGDFTSQSSSNSPRLVAPVGALRKGRDRHSASNPARIAEILPSELVCLRHESRL